MLGMTDKTKLFGTSAIGKRIGWDPPEAAASPILPLLRNWARNLHEIPLNDQASLGYRMFDVDPRPTTDQGYKRRSY